MYVKSFHSIQSNLMHGMYTRTKFVIRTQFHLAKDQVTFALLF